MILLILIWVLLFIFINQPFSSTAGGDLSMFYSSHAGFEPTLPRWLSAGWKGWIGGWEGGNVYTSLRFTRHRHLTDISLSFFVHWVHFHRFLVHTFASTVQPSTGEIGTSICYERCSLDQRSFGETEQFAWDSNAPTAPRMIQRRPRYPLRRSDSFITVITYYKMYGVITGFGVIPLCDSGLHTNKH